MSQVYDYMFAGKRLPRRPVVLTFDDGWASQWSAVQELNARKMKGVFFVMSRGIGLSDSQLRRMAASGHEIAAHSVSHSNLAYLSDAQIRYEVAQSKRSLEARLGRKVQFFAYPEGGYDHRVIKAVAAAGYRGGLAAWGGTRCTPGNRWAEPRIEVSGHYTLWEFAAWVQSARPLAQ